MTFIDMYPALARGGRRQPGTGAQADAQSRHMHATAQPAVGLVNESPARTSVFEDIALAHREIYALYEIAQAMGSSLGVADTMALISVEAEQHRPVLVLRAVSSTARNRRSLRCRFATGVESDIVQQLTIQQRPWPDRLGGAEPPAARERAGRAPTSRRPAMLDADDAAVGAGLPAGLQRALHRHDCRLSHSRRRSTPTIIAACSTGSPSRPPPSSTTRWCSSRRRKTRSPTR